MKKVISVMLTLCMVLSLAPAVFGQNPITVFVDDVQVVFDVEPVIENDRTLVPLRAIFEALGAEVSWEAETRTAVAEKENIEIRITIDENTLYKNNEAVALDAPARLISDRTLVPVRAISEGFGAEVAWNGETRRIDISLPTEQMEDTEVPAEVTEPEQDEEVINRDLPQQTYLFSEMAPKDMAQLESMCKEGNLIRYNFEQYLFPQTIFGNMTDVANVMSDKEAVKIIQNREIAKAIKNQNTAMLKIPREVWNLNVCNFIMKIQQESEETYVYYADESTTEKSLMDEFMVVAKEVGMTDEDAFQSISFAKIGTVPMLVLEFKDAGNILACQYIAVAVTSNDGIRYFTAETDVLDKEHLYFCEVTADARGTYITMGFNRSEFLSLVEYVVENDIRLQ